MSGTQWNDSDAPPQGGMRVVERTAGRAVVVSLTGDVDVDARERVAALFAKALAMKPTMLVVDASRIAFCDSSGLNLLLATRLDCQLASCRMVLVGTGTRFQRLLELTGADEVFEQVTTAAQALGE